MSYSKIEEALAYVDSFSKGSQFNLVPVKDFLFEKSYNT